MGDGGHRAFGAAVRRAVVVAAAVLLSQPHPAYAAESCYTRRVVPPVSTHELLGGLDKPTISAEIRQQMSPIRDCYANAVAFKDGRSGQVTLRLEISPPGAVTKVRLAVEPFDDAVAECIGRSACGWTFRPAKVGTVVVRFPIVFKGQVSPADLAARYLALPPTPLPGLPAVAVRQIGASFYVHESHDAHGVPSNGLIVELGGELLLVDTAWTDEQTARILDWGERRLGRKWIGAVITHEHADRDGGLATLLARKIPVAALDLTVDKLEKRGAHGVAPLFAAGASAGSRVFQDPRGFEAFFPGPGHAPDNVVLWFPDQQILFGGCLIKSASADSLGFTGDADLRAWPEAVRRVAARYRPALVVPGHGPIALGDAPLRHTLDLLTTKPTK